MTCSNRIEEIVELARRRGNAGVTLRAHLGACPECASRWEAERELSSHFHVMKIRAEARRPEPAGRRASLLREFDRMNPQKSAGNRWLWALSAAAALVLMIGAGRELGKRAEEVVESQSLAVDTVSVDADGLSSEEFIAVPYAPPLAAGEIVRMVRTELDLSSLAALGVNPMPLASGDSVVGDVVVGQDGFPRAVRFAGYSQTSELD